MQLQIEAGTQVICKAPSIDRKLGEGERGIVTGFARLSSYHAREAMVRLANGQSEWFWVRDLQPI